MPDNGLGVPLPTGDISKWNLPDVSRAGRVRPGLVASSSGASLGRTCEATGSPCGAGSRCAQRPGMVPRPLTQMHVQAALRAVREKSPSSRSRSDFPFRSSKRGILAMGDKRIGQAAPDVDRFVDDGNGVDGVLKDLSLSACHDTAGVGGDIGSDDAYGVGSKRSERWAQRPRG